MRQCRTIRSVSSRHRLLIGKVWRPDVPPLSEARGCRVRDYWRRGSARCFAWGAGVRPPSALFVFFSCIPVATFKSLFALGADERTNVHLGNYPATHHYQSIPDPLLGNRQFHFGWYQLGRRIVHDSRTLPHPADAIAAGADPAPTSFLSGVAPAARLPDIGPQPACRWQPSATAEPSDKSLPRRSAGGDARARRSLPAMPRSGPTATRAGMH